MPKSDDGIRYDMSQFYPMKSVLEKILGHKTYLILKETGNLADWKSAISKLFRAIELSVEETVKIADPTWYEDVSSVIEHGRSHCSAATHISDLFSSLSATLTELVFMQIGLVPAYGPRQDSVRLIPQNWRLDAFRTVQYVQSEEQKNALQSRLDRKTQRGHD